MLVMLLLKCIFTTPFRWLYLLNLSAPKTGETWNLFCDFVINICLHPSQALALSSCVYNYKRNILNFRMLLVCLINTMTPPSSSSSPSSWSRCQLLRFSRRRFLLLLLFLHRLLVHLFFSSLPSSWSFRPKIPVTCALIYCHSDSLF